MVRVKKWRNSPLAGAVVEDALGAQALGERVLEAEAGRQVLVVVVGDRQLQLVRHAVGDGEHVPAGKGDVLRARTRHALHEPPGGRGLRLRGVERQAQAVVAIAQRPADDQAARVVEVRPRLGMQPEDGAVEQDPAQELDLRHDLGHVVDREQAEIGRSDRGVGNEVDLARMARARPARRRSRAGCRRRRARPEWRARPRRSAPANGLASIRVACCAAPAASSTRSARAATDSPCRSWNECGKPSSSRLRMRLMPPCR